MSIDPTTMNPSYSNYPTTNEPETGDKSDMKALGDQYNTYMQNPTFAQAMDTVKTDSQELGQAIHDIPNGGDSDSQ